MKKIIFFAFYYILGTFLLLHYGPFILNNSSYPYFCVGCDFIPKSELIKWNLDYFYSVNGFLVGVLWPLYLLGLFVIMISS